MKTLFRSLEQTLRRIFKEKVPRTLLVVASIALGLFYPTGYAKQVLRDLPVIVVDQDHTPLSRQLTRWLDASEALTVAARNSDLPAAQDSIRSAAVGAVVLIPKDFERHVLRRESAFVEAYADATSLVKYSTAMKTINQVVGTMSAGVSIVGLRATGLTKDAAVVTARPLGLSAWPLFNAFEGYGHFLVPAVFILILQHTLIIGIAAVRVSERNENKGLDELPLWAIIGGKLGATELIYLGHTIFMFGLVFSIYGIPMHASWPTLFAFMVPYIAAVTLLGLTIAEMFRRFGAATAALAPLTLPAMFMSGAIYPVEAQAHWVQVVASFLPSSWGIRGFIQIGRMGATLEQAFVPWAMLWILVVVYGITAWLALRYRRTLAGSMAIAPTVMADA